MIFQFMKVAFKICNIFIILYHLHNSPLHMNGEYLKQINITNISDKRKSINIRRIFECILHKKIPTF